MYNILSVDEKRDLLREIIGGASVSKVAKEAGISRTVIYNWLKRYKNIGCRGRKTILMSQVKKGKDHWKRLNKCSEFKIIRAALKNPFYSPFTLATITGISATGVWLVLKRYSLNTQTLRCAYYQKHRMVLIPQISPGDRMSMISGYEAGKRISAICRENKISRTIFYRWLRRFRDSGGDASCLKDQRPRMNKHWKYVNSYKVKKLILNIVPKHPEYSARKISRILIDKDNKPIASMSFIHYALVDLELNTKEKRLLFAASYRTIVSRLFGLLAIILPKLSGYYFTSYRSPPPANYILMYIRFLIVSFSIVLVSAFAIFVFHNVENNDYSLILLKKDEGLISSPILLPTIVREKLSPIPITKKGNIEKNVNKQIVYIVKEGDSLWYISKNIYGEPFLWTEIAKENKLVNPNLIYPGEELVIPVVGDKEL